MYVVIDIEYGEYGEYIVIFVIKKIITKYLLFKNEVNVPLINRYMIQEPTLDYSIIISNFVT